ncbi:hypothetical protein C8J57DRAFT_1282020 [Mycena rebaudengoi]|nr:hypothetical protein C8J57DRAFT_1282020 [Mycena rebaudengoi]
MLFKSTELLAFVILSVLTTSLGQFATTCNSPSGTISSGAGNCSAFTTLVCDSIAPPSAPGTPTAFKLPAQGTAARCFSLADGLGRTCAFTVANTKTVGPSTFPDNAKCKAAFKNVTSKCDFGGRSVIGTDGFTVKLDFNFATCFT